MDAEQIVGEAVAALARGDIVGHLRQIAEDVQFQVNENAPQNGKSAYQHMLELILASGEVIAGFTLVGNATRIGDQDVIQVHVAHIPRHEDAHPDSTISESYPYNRRLIIPMALRRALTTGSRHSRRSALAVGAAGLASLLASGCVATGNVVSPTPTPLSPRGGDNGEVLLGIFGSAAGPAPASPIREVATRVSGTGMVSRLPVRVVPVPYTGWPNDLDTQGFVPNSPPELLRRKGPAWQLFTALHDVTGTLAVPDLVVFDRMDQVRYAADHQLLLPIDQYLVPGSPPVIDAWPGALDVARYQGHTWALPLALQPLVLTYQPDAFRSAGLRLPAGTWDWQQLLAAAKALTKTSHLAWQAPDEKGGQFGFFVGAPDTLPLLIWQAGGEVLAGKGTQVFCALDTPSAIAGELFYFDLVHRDEVSPAQALTGELVAANGQRFGTAAMQFGPANTANIALPPRGPVTASGYAFDATGPCLALTARAANPERAYLVAAALMAKAQGGYDWPVSQASANARAGSSPQAGVAIQALRLVHPPGGYGNVRAAVEERVAPALVGAVAPPAAAVLSGRSIVQSAAKSACGVVDAAVRAVHA